MAFPITRRNGQPVTCLAAANNATWKEAFPQPLLLQKKEKNVLGYPKAQYWDPIIFTIEFPEVIHDHPCPAKDNHPCKPNLNSDSSHCGSICTYADNSTYSTSEGDSHTLSEKISTKLTVMADFLSSSKPKVNDENTHTILLTTSQMR